MTVKEELLSYISELTPEQVDQVISHLPRLIAALEAQGQPVPQIDLQQTP